MSSTPSPSPSCRHADGAPVQVHAGSIVHAAEQPSPSRWLPSSQSSAPAMMPAPQPVVHADVAPVQLQPGATVQIIEQPSPLTRAPSSQASNPATTPSPQVVA